MNYNGSCKCNRKSFPGYTYITNNIEQTVATDQLVIPGSVVRTSCIGTIVPTGNNALTITKTGTYLIDVQLIGTPVASGAETEGTIQPTISVNGLILSSPVIPVTATNYETQFLVRAITPLECGDVVTFTNTGSFSLEMAASNVLGGYNINIIFERFN